MYITAQGCRLRNDLYCVEWDVKLYYTIPYHTRQTDKGKNITFLANWTVQKDRGSGRRRVTHADWHGPNRSGNNKTNRSIWKLPSSARYDNGSGGRQRWREMGDDAGRASVVITTATDRRCTAAAASSCWARDEFGRRRLRGRERPADLDILQRWFLRSRRLYVALNRRVRTS